ncbi:Rv3235 family protein [Pseudarthrobacter sp. NPDC127529]
MPAVTPIRALQGRTESKGDRGLTPAAASQEALGQSQLRQGQLRALGQGRPAPHSGEPVRLRAADEEAEVRAITRGTVQAAMEVLAGIRPVHQLARRLDPRCLAALQHRAALIRREITRTGNPTVGRLHRNSIVRSVRICEVAEGTYEASAVVVDDVRARAVAIRLERSKQVWRVTELVIG